MTRLALPKNRLIVYALAAIATLLMVGARMLLDPVLGSELPFVTLFPAVFLAAWTGGLGPALLATLLSVTSALYFFISPPLPMSLSDPVAQLGACPRHRPGRRW